MDQYLDLVLVWFKRLGIEKIDLEKLKRQFSIIANWFKNNANGCVLAVTGFGKTMVAIITIYRLNLKLPNAKIIVVVPSLNLFNDWQNHIIDYELKNVTVYVVNGYAQRFIETQIQYECDLLIVDEVHNILSENGKVFNQTLKATKRLMFMGLSATLNDEEIEILHQLGIPIVDQVTMSEAQRFNYIADHTIYNIGVELDAEEREVYNKYNDIHNSNFAKFHYFADREKNYDLIRACIAGNDVRVKVGSDWKSGRQWREWYAEVMGWDGTEENPWNPKNINKAAHQWNWAMRERKDLIYKNPKKLELAAEIIRKFNLPTITFGQVTDTADRLTEMLGEQARSYHTAVVSGVEKTEVIEERKTLKSARMLRNRTQGVLTPIPIGNGKATYQVKFIKEVKISAKKVLHKIKTEFETGVCKFLNTAKALDEGYNVEGIKIAILYAITSSQRNFIQRIGRALRFIFGKHAIIIVIYIKDSQEETWLRSAQKGLANIKFINNIDEII